MGFLLVSVMLLLPALCCSENTFAYSRASFYGSPDYLGQPSGACGFREYGRTANDAQVAAVSRLWRNGTGCGACYQVRCKVPEVCTDAGVYVVVSDYGEGDNTDFILSPRAYGGMARGDASAQLYSYGVVDVEYRRVPCRYNGYNLLAKVDERSNYPHYLALVILYFPGQYDIVSVQIWEAYRKEWVAMRKAYGAVYDIANLPAGPIILRFQLSTAAGLTWVVANNAMPSEWKAGVSYDSAVQNE